MKYFLYTFFIALGIYFTSCGPGEYKNIEQEMEEALTEKLLHQWYPRAIDEEYGGYLPHFNYKWDPVEPQHKMIVSQGRHMWTPSKASHYFPEDERYPRTAAKGLPFLKEHMWDEEYGGFYMTRDRQGRPLNEKPVQNPTKRIYGNAFAIYGLAAYYELTGDEAALDLARKGFHWLEENAYDPLHKGYFENVKRSGKWITLEEKQSGAYGEGDPRVAKDQNTSIHMLEAYTELYRVWPDSLLEERLESLLHVIRDRMVDDKGYLHLFFERDLTPISYRDSSRDYIQEHLHTDHVSFGHDIETAFLMMEASHVLGKQNDTTTLNVAKKMVDHTLAQGWDEEVGGIYDGGYYFKGDDSLSIVMDTKVWWAQAEALHSLLYFAKLFPEERKYYEAFKKEWDYIQEYMIDHEHGGWYSGGLDKEPEAEKEDKGHMWKTAYHNGRALMSCLKMLRPDDQAPSAPSNLEIKDNDGKQISLSWESSTDNKHIVGYNIYRNGKRIGYSPDSNYTLYDTSGKNGGDFTVKAWDLHENLSEASNVVAVSR